MTGLPILIPFLAMIFLAVSGTRIILQKIIAVATSLVLLVVAVFILIRVDQEGIMVMYAGGWKAPIGISLVIDSFSALLLVATAIVGFCMSIYAVKGLDEKRHQTKYYLFFFGMIMGINGAFITGDIFNMYVWFEVMLMASFILMVLGNEREQLEGGLKYMTISLLGSLLFLAGIGILYGHAGTLNLAHLSMKFREIDLPPAMNIALALLMTAFAIKSAAFPFFFWLPSSYHTPPPAVSALFAGLLTKVGIYAMVRIVTLFFDAYDQFWHGLLLVISGFTMVVGAVAAFSQTDIRRVLSFSIISQMGYLIMGLGFFTPLGIAAAIYFMLHNILVKTNLFLVAGIVGRTEGSYNLGAMGGWYQKFPGITLLYFLSAMALAGFPPLSGFFGKFLLAKAGLESQHELITGISIFTALITVAYMFKIWNGVFWKQTQDIKWEGRERPEFSMVFPSTFLTVLILYLGLGAGPVFDILQKTAGQLLDPSGYIGSVLEYENTL
ncbi:MAG: Na+/H+ antiporter subunit D [Cyclobacteriaceae bacterium]|nr:Na+/H+ antiporter subunit D [Cyclobacteriaceae bacterium]